MGFCTVCLEPTTWNPDEGIELHAEGSACPQAQPPEARRERLDMLLSAAREHGERYIVTEGFRRLPGGRREYGVLVALRDGRNYGLDYHCRGLVRAGHAYRGVRVENGVGKTPSIVVEEMGEHGFFVALDPMTEEAVTPYAVERERFAAALRESPLVFRVDRDRSDATKLVAMLKVGSVVRYSKEGIPRGSRGPFRLDQTLLDRVRIGGTYVGVPANRRFTHVFLDVEVPQRATEMLRGPWADLVKRVEAWNDQRKGPEGAAFGGQGETEGVA